MSFRGGVKRDLKYKCLEMKNNKKNSECKVNSTFGKILQTSINQENIMNW
jgi:hypothetical protein